MKSTQHGFTLIELIVVIVILGILGATALPRFADMTTQADRAAVAGVAGAFGSAVQLARAQYLVTADADGVDIQGFGNNTVDVCISVGLCPNSFGYPVGTGAVTPPPLPASDAICLLIWNGIMQNPPNALGQAATTTTAGTDWNATVVGTTCQYSYRRAIATGTASTRLFVYTPATGAVVVTN